MAHSFVLRDDYGRPDIVMMPKVIKLIVRERETFANLFASHKQY